MFAQHEFAGNSLFGNREIKVLQALELSKREPIEVEIKKPGELAIESQFQFKKNETRGGLELLAVNKHVGFL